MSESFFGLQRKTAAILALIIILFAVCAGAYTHTLGRAFRKPSGDGARYEVMAKQLLTTHVYGYRSTKPNAYVTPGYPLFLAAVYGVSGHSVDGRPRSLLVGLQVLFACLTILGVFMIARTLAGDVAGLIAAALVALYPPTLVATNLWLTETLATFALVWFVYVAVLASRQQGWKLWALAGALLGVAVLVRPAVLPFGVAPFIALLITGPRGDLWKGLVAFGVAWALVMTPWVVRNEISLHEPAVLSSHSGDPFLAGVDPYYYEQGLQYVFHGPTYERYMNNGAKGSKDDAANAAILKGFREHPLRYAWWFTLGKTVHIYSTGWLGTRDIAGTWTTLVRGLVVVLGWLGVAYAVRDRKLLGLALMLVIGSAGLLPFVPERRFVFSYLPLLSVLAGIVMYRLWSAPLPAPAPADQTAATKTAKQTAKGGR
jgi:4-amino-4-deoxy-L-arabinose transferase-like glycosyltransferase